MCTRELIKAVDNTIDEHGTIYTGNTAYLDPEDMEKRKAFIGNLDGLTLVDGICRAVADKILARVISKELAVMSKMELESLVSDVCPGAVIIEH